MPDKYPINDSVKSIMKELQEFSELDDKDLLKLITSYMQMAYLKGYSAALEKAAQNFESHA